MAKQKKKIRKLRRSVRELETFVVNHLTTDHGYVERDGVLVGTAVSAQAPDAPGRNDPVALREAQ